MDVFLVSHTHWDREWYRTFQAFRARLVDTVDRVLDLIASDPGYVFLLDGQAVVLEDYLEVRPGRRPELEKAVRAGRIAIGPWYVQPDSLLPSGESHARNLLEGRRVASAFGPVSAIAYTPDSFGHPASYPQILAGFGLRAFVYWRGNGDEIAELPAEWRWVAPDGTSITACHLGKGYFNAAALPDDPAEAAARIRAAVDDLAPRARNGRVLLMNGSDHLLPDGNTRTAAEAAGARRALLEDFVDGLPDALPSFTGELIGGRVANLLPGVWSTRTPIKLRNRRCEALLEGWAEPWSALGAVLGTPDERPALRTAWRALLQNQAHDSICGCSQDAVHEQMLARYDTAEELARETTQRTLERIAGLGAERRVPRTDGWDVAVFNPSPHTRTDVVRFPLDPYPPFGAAGEGKLDIHPMLRANVRPRSFTVDGVPARLVPAGEGRRLRLVPDQRDWEVEFVARDVPAFGYRTVRLEPGDDVGERADDASEISVDGVAASIEDGALTVSFGDAVFRGLTRIEDTGDRGDSYDFDPVEPGGVRIANTDVRRRVHPSGIGTLRLRRTGTLPAGLDEGRTSRSGEAPFDLIVEARIATGVRRVDLHVTLHTEARDHRLRLLFPTGVTCDAFDSATTFGVARRTTAPRDDRAWRHPAPRTFPHQGWISAGGLTVSAPGLPEAEVTPDGTIAITLVRSVGWLSRPDLRTRPGPAGPSIPVPGAQCAGTVEARILLLPSPDGARDAEIGLWAVAAGPEPLLDAGTPMVTLEPSRLELSALKPAEDGDGIVLRVLNPVREPLTAVVRLGFAASRAVGVRLDETPSGEPVELDGRTLRFDVPESALRSVLLG